MTVATAVDGMTALREAIDESVSETGSTLHLNITI